MHQVAHSSSGPGHRPLKAEIGGSNPPCATKYKHEITPDRKPRAIFSGLEFKETEMAHSTDLRDQSRVQRFTTLTAMEP